MKSSKIPGIWPNHEVLKIHRIQSKYETPKILGIKPNNHDYQYEFGVVLARNYDFFIMFMEICFKVVLS